MRPKLGDIVVVDPKHPFHANCCGVVAEVRESTAVLGCIKPQSVFSCSEFEFIVDEKSCVVIGTATHEKLKVKDGSLV